MCSDMYHTVLPANYTTPAFTPQPQSITALWLDRDSFTVPRTVKGWVDLGGWLHTKIKCRLRESNPDTITHPSTNWAQRRFTSLIETNALHTMPNRHSRPRLSHLKVTSSMWQKVHDQLIMSQQYSLHTVAFQKYQQQNVLSDCLDLLGRIRMLPWLNTLSTGALNAGTDNAWTWTRTRF